MRLKDKVAVITGAGAGIGEGCARMFAAQGARLVLVDLGEEPVNQTAQSIASDGHKCLALGGIDLTDSEQVDHCAKRISNFSPKVDILVNAAAFAVFAWIEDMTHEQWRATLVGELDIVFLMTKALWDPMKASGKASIVNFASANAHGALESSPALAHCAGKGGVLGMTRQLAMEGAPHGIRANTISPGLIETDATRQHIESDPGFVDQVLTNSMIKRVGKPEDIAYAAVYLASDEASFVTGADFSIDAGATAW
jgi:NAD(P)-dependent dehydrogenase (short-subunit alcohol dehydrogenase family)